MQQPGAPEVKSWIVHGLLPVLLFLLLGNAGRYGAFLASHGPAGFGDYLDALCVWDCAWYRTIVERGYDLAPITCGPGARTGRSSRSIR